MTNTPQQTTDDDLRAALFWHASALETAAADVEADPQPNGFVTVHRGTGWRVETRATPVGADGDPHAGLSCEEVETVLRIRVDQLTEARDTLRDAPRAAHPAALVRDLTAARREARAARDELGRLRIRVAARDEQAECRLTAEEEYAEKLAAVAGVEAYLHGRVDDLQSVSPTTIAGTRAQLSLLTIALADVARVTPGLLDDLRAAIVAEHTAKEEQA